MGLQLTADVDLSTARSLTEVQHLLATAAAERAPDAWVQAWGLDPGVFGRRAVTSAPIDAAVGGRPAFVRLFDAHSALATPAALRIAGVDGPREFAQRSSVVCDDAGRPTGLLLEAAAMDLATDRIPREPVAVRAARLRTLLDDMAATGLAVGHVMDLLGDSAKVVAAAEDLGDLPLRLRFAPWCEPGIDADGLAELTALQGRGGRRWEISGVRFFIDGTIDNGTARLELRTVLTTYTEHYNAGRAHRSLGLRAPDDDPNVVPLPAGEVRRRQLLGGLLNEYRTMAPRLPQHPQETPSSAA
ncbi:amidohydrolase family protein [Streptomyces asiaticus]